MLNVQTNFSTYRTIKFSALPGLLHADANSETVQFCIIDVDAPEKLLFYCGNLYLLQVVETC